MTAADLLDLARYLGAAFRNHAAIKADHAAIICTALHPSYGYPTWCGKCAACEERREVGLLLRRATRRRRKLLVQLARCA